MASEFEEMETRSAALEAALGDLQGLAEGFGNAMTSAFRSAVIEGERLEDVLGSLAMSLSGRALASALGPLEQGIGGILGGLMSGVAQPFAASGGLAAPSYLPPKILPGPASAAVSEAMPLARAGETRAPASAVNVTFNVNAGDAESFRRSEAEVTAMLARAVARGRRGL